MQKANSLKVDRSPLECGWINWSLAFIMRPNERKLVHLFSVSLEGSPPILFSLELLEVSDI